MQNLPGGIDKISWHFVVRILRASILPVLKCSNSLLGAKNTTGLSIFWYA